LFSDPQRALDHVVPYLGKATAADMPRHRGVSSGARSEPYARVIQVPDALGGEPDRVEIFLAAVQGSSWSPGDVPVLDLSGVTWVRPYGAMQLLLCCEEVAAVAGHPVRLRGLHQDVHAYLRRINFSLAAAGAAAIADSFDDSKDFARTQTSFTVLELTRIATQADVWAVVARAQRILARWLALSPTDAELVCGLITEACNNIVYHSDTTGWMLVQKYKRDTAGVVDVELAIGDGGVGIRRTLEAVHGPIANNDSGFIVGAVKGLTRRGVSETGQGLPQMRVTATGTGGYLFVRSGHGRALATREHTQPLDHLQPSPGTQVAMRFRSIRP
jgi:hypothetical protein